MEEILHRMPAMEHAEIRQFVNGPESFTPDMHAILGEAPEVCWGVNTASHYTETTVMVPYVHGYWSCKLIQKSRHFPATHIVVCCMCVH